MPVARARLHARATGGRVRLEVTDTGPGIPAAILPRLFEPFVTSKPAGAGLGLGLVISAQSVRAMDGTFRAANAEGGGACFVVELPQAPAPMVAASVPAPAPRARTQADPSLQE